MLGDQRTTVSAVAASDPAYADVVDTHRYPIHDLTNPATRALIADCQRQLDETGVAVLHDFLRPAAIAAMVGLALELAPRAHKSDQTHNVWFTTPDPSDPHDVQVRSSKHGIAYDLIPADAPVRSTRATTSPASSPPSSTSRSCTAAPIRSTRCR